MDVRGKMEGWEEAMKIGTDSMMGKGRIEN